MKNKIGFFEEEEGIRSMTRLMSFITLFFAFIFAWYYLIVDGKIIDTMFITYFTLLICAAFVPKHLQKVAELKKEETQIVADSNIEKEPINEQK